MPSVPDDLTDRLDDGGFDGLSRIAVDGPGWPAPIVAVEIEPLLDRSGDDDRWSAVERVWAAAAAAVAGTGHQPVLAEVELTADGLPPNYEIPVYADPRFHVDELGELEAEIQRWVCSQFYVPEVDRLPWSLASHRNGGERARGSDRIEEYLEWKVEEVSEPLGLELDVDEVEAAVDAEGRPIESYDVADWWFHRLVLGAVGERALLGRLEEPFRFFEPHAVTLLLLPSPGPAAGIGGLLPSSPFALPFEHAPLTWAAFVAKWARRWGAQLVCTGHTAALTVARPPATIAEAIPVALEHQLFSNQAPRSGRSVYEYAYELVDNDTWMLTTTI